MIISYYLAKGIIPDPITSKTAVAGGAPDVIVAVAGDGTASHGSFGDGGGYSFTTGDGNAGGDTNGGDFKVILGIKGGDGNYGAFKVEDGGPGSNYAEIPKIYMGGYFPSAASISFCINSFEFAPTILVSSFPFLKRIKSGMLKIWRSVASSVLLSTFTFANLTFPLYSDESSSIAGPIMRHGMHHSAQKSTRTGTFESKTSALKLSAFISIKFSGTSFSFFIHRWAQMKCADNHRFHHLRLSVKMRI